VGRPLPADSGRRSLLALQLRTRLLGPLAGAKAFSTRGLIIFPPLIYSLLNLRTPGLLTHPVFEPDRPLPFRNRMVKQISAARFSRHLFRRKPASMRAKPSGVTETEAAPVKVRRRFFPSLHRDPWTNRQLSSQRVEFGRLRSEKNGSDKDQTPSIRLAATAPRQPVPAFPFRGE
jgi:hypothetical protein